MPDGCRGGRNNYGSPPNFVLARTKYLRLNFLYLIVHGHCLSRSLFFLFAKCNLATSKLQASRMQD
jgi:hypothetical protein